MLVGDVLVIAAALVVGFVPQIPYDDALVVRKRPDDVFHIGFELVILTRILQPRLAGRLDPARIVDAGDRRALQAIDRVRVPHAEIGRGSWRGRGGQEVVISVVAVSLKKKKKK